ncbi:MAG TPA: NAD(+) diphosphatase [Pedococcus sp.]
MGRTPVTSSLTTPQLPGVALARSVLDRAAQRRSDPHLLGSLVGDRGTRVLTLVGDAAEVREDAGGPRLVLRAPTPADATRLGLFLGSDGDGAAYLAVLDDAADDGDARDLRTLRQVGADLGDLDASLLTTALGLANWHRAHTHCPRCGAATRPEQGGWLRRCTEDGSEHYPRTDPAVIMSVVDGDDRLLMARGAGWGEGRYSVLAGFVEPGETLEAAVTREVREEVGVEVTDVRFLGDQPWPFPTSIMLGFTARALGTELTLQDSEIADARWFAREELLAKVADGELFTSPRLSISRWLVEQWLGREITPPPVDERRTG